MKLKQLADCSNIIIERYGLKLCAFLFIISSLVMSLCWLDSKTSIYSTDYEIKYTCNKVYGIGDNTSNIISQLQYGEYSNFVEVKNDYRWFNLQKVNENFTFGRNIMRQELYQSVLYALFLTNAISFAIMFGLYLYKKYTHDYIMRGLTKMIKETNNHNHKT